VTADMSMTAPQHPDTHGMGTYRTFLHFTFRTWRAFFRLISFN
jgi:hypothetical protein